VTPFSAEKTLTKDTVPVDVDAVLFWWVWDAEKAALEVADYNSAIAWAAQTALRDIIGRHDAGRHSRRAQRHRRRASAHHLIERTTPWGVTVNSVEIRRHCHPARTWRTPMSRQAQAERESPGARHPGRFRETDRRFVCRGLQIVYQ